MADAAVERRVGSPFSLSLVAYGFSHIFPRRRKGGLRRGAGMLSFLVAGGGWRSRADGRGGESGGPRAETVQLFSHILHAHRRPLRLRRTRLSALPIRLCAFRGRSTFPYREGREWSPIYPWAREAARDVAARQHQGEGSFGSARVDGHAVASEAENAARYPPRAITAHVCAARPPSSRPASAVPVVCIYAGAHPCPGARVAAGQSVAVRSATCPPQGVW